MEIRTAGLAVIKSGVPVLVILPTRLKQRIVNSVGGSEEAIDLAVSSIASFYDVIVNSIGGDVRTIETDISKIYILPVDAETKILLFVPGGIDVDKMLLDAFVETVRKVTDTKELERRLTKLLESLNKPEAEFLPQDRNDVDALAEIVGKVSLDEVYNVYKIAVSILAPAGVPNAQFFHETTIRCIQKAPILDPAEADKVIEEILNANVHRLKAHVMKNKPRYMRKFSGGEIVRVPAPEYDKILACTQHLKDRKAFLDAFLERFAKMVSEYMNKRPAQIEEEIRKKKEYLEKLRKRAEENRKRVEEEIFLGIFSDEYSRAEDLFNHVMYRRSQLEDLYKGFPGRPPKGLSEFKERLGSLYTRVDRLSNVISSIEADVMRIKDEISKIEESISEKTSSHNKAVEEELKSVYERIKTIKSSISELEAELSRINKIRKVRSTTYKKVYKKASKLLSEVNAALEEINELSIGYTSVAFIVYVFEGSEGMYVYVPPFYKNRKEHLVERAQDKVLSGAKPLDPKIVREAVMKAIARKKSKRFEKRMRNVYRRFL